jgi:hypothetical protein
LGRSDPLTNWGKRGGVIKIFILEIYYQYKHIFNL